jgi:5-methylcytosine-specific restriction enzyme B
MSQADQVREYCRSHYVEPARARGDSTVDIRAGDVHSALGLKNRYPLVCSAIAATVFEELNRVRRVGSEGPHSGANTVFRFRTL